MPFSVGLRHLLFRRSRRLWKWSHHVRLCIETAEARETEGAAIHMAAHRTASCQAPSKPQSAPQRSRMQGGSRRPEEGCVAPIPPRYHHSLRIAPVYIAALSLYLIPRLSIIERLKHLMER